MHQLVLFVSASAHGIVCRALVKEFSGFLWKPDKIYKPELELFGAPPEAVDAKMKVKQCANGISFEKKILLTKALVISSFFLHRSFCSAHIHGGALVLF